MKKSLIIVLLVLTVLAPCFSLTVKDLQGIWLLRLNGDEVGYLVITNYTGIIRSGSSGEDTIFDLKLDDSGNGGYRLTFERRGSVNETYTGWVSSNGRQIAGFYVKNGAEYPWWAEK